MTHKILADVALRRIDKILTLQDRNPHSPTYGCFDRNHWHYRIIDFPSGMAQEFVWPLALAYDTDTPGNVYYQVKVLRQWVRAGIDYAAKSAHRDGSCDDYFPYEKAAGAAAFSLLACVESCALMGFDPKPFANFFTRRADWLADHQESGRLTNHHALIVLGLLRCGDLLKDNRWHDAAMRRLECILDWQHHEGWFPEYEGFDPGYQTLTLSCLAQVMLRMPEHDRLHEALHRAAQLTAQFVHPDGSFGGEYTSRNTYNYFPQGFELLGRDDPALLAANDLFLAGLDRGLGACDEDDHVLAHHAWNYLLAWRDYAPNRPAATIAHAGRTHLPAAGVLLDRRKDITLIVAMNKGGVLRCFDGDKLVAADTGPSLLIDRGGRIANAVAHLVGRYETQVQEDQICVEGDMSWAKHTQMTPAKLVVLRVLMLTVGRLFPNVVRRLLQRLLIVGRDAAPASFRRQITWRDGGWWVRDVVRCADWSKVRAAGIGPAQTSIYVVMSRTFQRSQLRDWIDLSDRIKGLGKGDELVIERRIGVCQ